MKLSPEMTNVKAKPSVDEDSTTGRAVDLPNQTPDTVDDDEDDDVGTDNPMDGRKPPAFSEYKETRAVSLVNGSFGIAIQPAPTSAGHLEDMEEQRAEPDEEIPSMGPLSYVDGSYVNHGLVTWEKNREKWLQRQTTNSPNTNHVKPINVDAVIDAVFSSAQKMRKTGGIGETFPQSVPLPQMVDILQDLWEAETL